MPDYAVKVTTKLAETVKVQRVGQAEPDNIQVAPPQIIERLVRAKNEARAIAHVVKDTISIDRASTDDVIRLTQAGVKMEQAE
jgi:hypothetical protein